jgi:electron transport complex protein RnfG
MENEQQHNAPALPQEKEPSSFRLIATLGIAGLLSGMLLVGVYIVTLPIIQANKAEALKEAIYQVLPGCTAFETLELRDGKLVVLSAAEAASNEENTPRLYAGYGADEQLIGFAIVAEAPGYQEEIRGMFGYAPDKKLVVGFEVLESKETPGLGDKIKKDKDFIANFKALAVEPEIVLVKSGQKQAPNEVDGITGATISSRAVVKLLQNGLESWRPAIEAYVNENNPQP